MFLDKQTESEFFESLHEKLIDLSNESINLTKTACKLKNTTEHKEIATSLKIAKNLLNEIGFKKEAQKIKIILDHIDPDEATEGLTSEKMVENLLHHGHPLNETKESKMDCESCENCNDCQNCEVIV